MDCGNSIELMTNYARKPKSKMSPKYLRSMEKQAESLFGINKKQPTYEERLAKGLYKLAGD